MLVVFEKHTMLALILLGKASEEQQVFTLRRFFHPQACFGITTCVLFIVLTRTHTS